MKRQTHFCVFCLSDFLVRFFSIRVLEGKARPFIPEKTSHTLVMWYCQYLNGIITHLSFVLQPPILNNTPVPSMEKFKTIQILLEQSIILFKLNIKVYVQWIYTKNL